MIESTDNVVALLLYYQGPGLAAAVHPDSSNSKEKLRFYQSVTSSTRKIVLEPQKKFLHRNPSISPYK